MHCHCGTNNRASRWAFTDPCKAEVRPGAREESASPAWLAAPAMNARYTTKVYIWRRDTGCGLTLYRKCHSHNTPGKRHNNTWVEPLAGNCTTSSTRQREQVWQKCKIQKNWCKPLLQSACTFIWRHRYVWHIVDCDTQHRKYKSSHVSTVWRDEWLTPMCVIQYMPPFEIFRSMDNEVTLYRFCFVYYVKEAWFFLIFHAEDDCKVEV